MNFRNHKEEISKYFAKRAKCLGQNIRLIQIGKIIDLFLSPFPIIKYEFVNFGIILKQNGVIICYCTISPNLLFLH